MEMDWKLSPIQVKNFVRSVVEKDKKEIPLNYGCYSKN